ncbi:hypothetical protein [Ideonella sp. A 288]|uniref:hypothetical protein n=1 Tax=Ideonella sp. A 288 TaxID=1962181 RepID=UPI001F3A384B|nr:hypothetical protein [Ideonella sp. A 288]
MGTVMPQLLRKRFAELDAQASELAKTRAISRDFNGGTDENVDHEQFLAWCVKSRNLLVSVCGQDSEHYKAFVEAESYSSWSGNLKNFSRKRAVFGAARWPYETARHMATTRRSRRQMSIQ